MMCCEKLTKKINRKKYYMSEKLDGTRAMFIDGKLINRRGIDVSKKYPHIVAELNEQIPRGILDGELVVLNENNVSKLNLVQRKVNWKKAKFMVFDYIRDGNGTDITRKTLNARLCLLDYALIQNDFIKIINHTLPKEETINKFRGEGREGVIFKLISSPYLINWNNISEDIRSRYWLKYKFTKEFVVNIIDFKDESGRGSHGSLITNMCDVGLLTIGNKEFYFKNKPKQAIIIGEQELTENGRILKPILKEFILNGERINALNSLHNNIRGCFI